MSEAKQEELLDPQPQFTTGVKTFSRLITRWMDTNEWSHPTMVSLAKSVLDGASWLHSSQISGFRHATLLSPGPRCFVALERLNYYVHRYATTKKLLPNTENSNLYRHAFAITENGEPPSSGWWIEVFVGRRIPSDIDVSTSFFTEEQAREFSQKWGALIRKLMMQKSIDLITELDKTLRVHYTAGDADRVEMVASVIKNNQTWTADQLAYELPAISALTSHLGGPDSESALLDALKR